MRPPEPLGDQHQRDGFDCGEESLNRWLRQRARNNERLGVSRTLVVCPERSNEVIAYSCLSAGAIVLAGVPGGLRRNMPNPMPVVVLGRLAVDRPHQGLGLGHALVADALSRSLQARQLIGARALLVHAIDAQAAAFYRSLGFRPSTISALTLMLPLGKHQTDEDLS
jgi:GNAT superfamily N-acetyltransferase